MWVGAACAESKQHPAREGGGAVNHGTVHSLCALHRLAQRRWVHSTVGCFVALEESVVDTCVLVERKKGSVKCDCIDGFKLGRGEPKNL